MSRRTLIASSALLTCVVGGAVLLALRQHPLGDVPPEIDPLEEHPQTTSAQTADETQASLPSKEVPGSVPAVASPPWKTALQGLATWTIQGAPEQDSRITAAAAVLRGQVGESLGYWRESSLTANFKGVGMSWAILQAITDADETAVLAALETCPFLIKAVVAHHWTAAAAPILRRGLITEPAPPFTEQAEWARTLAEIATPEDLPALRLALQRMRNGKDQAEIISTLSSLLGASKPALLADIWGVRFPGDYTDGQTGLAQMAAQAGVRDAFVTCGLMPEIRRLTAPMMRELAAWLATQPATGGKSQLPDWYRENRPRFVFTDGVWQLGPPPPPWQPASPAPVAADPPVPPPPPGLAADGDAAAVTAWIDAKATEVKGNRNLPPTDPLYAQFAALPPARLEAILAAQDKHRSNWIIQTVVASALPKLARLEHRDLVLAQLERHPDLIPTLLPHGWGQAAAPTLRRLLYESRLAGRHPLTIEAIRVLTDLGDPGDAELISLTFQRIRQGEAKRTLAGFIAKHPGVDLPGLIRTLWERTQGADPSRFRDYLAVQATRIGIAEALPLAMAQASDDRTSRVIMVARQEARDFIAGLFHLPAEEEAIADWWAKAKPLVVWDESRQTWIGPTVNQAQEPANF